MVKQKHSQTDFMNLCVRIESSLPFNTAKMHQFILKCDIQHQELEAAHQ